MDPDILLKDAKDESMAQALQLAKQVVRASDDVTAEARPASSDAAAMDARRSSPARPALLFQSRAPNPEPEPPWESMPAQRLPEPEPAPQDQDEVDPEPRQQQEVQSQQPEREGDAPLPWLQPEQAQTEPPAYGDFRDYPDESTSSDTDAAQQQLRQLQELLNYNRGEQAEFEYDDSACDEWCGLPQGESTHMKCGLFWFLHVPKTGGTTLASWLKERAEMHGWSYANMWRLSLNETEKGPMDSEVHWRTWNQSIQWQHHVLQELKRPRPHIIVHDHHQMPGLGNRFLREEVLKPMARELAEKGCEMRFATSLRDPVSHSMSRIRNEFATEGIHERFMNFSKANSNSMAKYVVYNFQTQWPANLKTFSLQPQADEDLLADASEILSTFDLVGRTEDFEAFFTHIRSTLGWEGSKLPEAENSHDDYLQRAIDAKMESILGGSEVSEATAKALQLAMKRDVSRQTQNNTLWAHESAALRTHNAIDSRLYHQFCASSPYSVCRDRETLRSRPDVAERLSLFASRYEDDVWAVQPDEGQ